MDDQKKEEIQAERWVFTWNNYPKDVTDEYLLKKFVNATFMIVGKEVGEKGTPHLQGYVEFKSKKRGTTLYKAFPKVNFEIAKGTAEQNITYCGKQEVFIKYGEPKIKEQGKRNDINDAMGDIKKGMSEIEIFEKHPAVAFKYLKGMDRYRSLCQKEARKGYNKKEVIVYWGGTRTGKTRAVMEEHPDAFIVSEGVTGFWWTGYDDEEVVLLDEFRGNIPLSQLLRILDGYAVQVSVHGGSKYLNAKKIFITSNVDPELWYKNCDEESKKALKARFNKVKYFPSL